MSIGIAGTGRMGRAMAERLIESFTSDWNPRKYKDTYREELCAIIKAKRKGKDVHRAAEVEEEEGPVDIMEALRASLEQKRPRKKTTTSKGKAKTSTRKRTSKRAA